MCPDTQFLIAAFLVFALVASIIYRRLFECIAKDFETLSGILEAPSRRDTFFRTYIEGYYKERKVTLMCPHFDEGSPRTFYVEPRNIPNPQKGFFFAYPRPNENTQWKGAKVFYSHGRGLFRLKESYYKVYAQEELLRILEDLSDGADRVERGAVLPG